MNALQWIELLGRSSEDSQLRAALAKAKVKEIPPIEDDEIDVRIRLGDVMLVFSSSELFPDLAEGGDGTTILSGVLLPAKDSGWGEYKGALPHGLDRADSRQKLRKRFGKPTEADEDFRWDEWNVDDRMLRVEYGEDLNSLGYVMISLPESE